MRKANACSSEIAMARELATLTWILADSTASKEIGKLYSGKFFRCPLVGDHWHGEVVAGLTGNGASYMEHIWLSLFGPKFEIGIQIKEVISY